jgi:hypothetical protein
MPRRKLDLREKHERKLELMDKPYVSAKRKAYIAMIKRSYNYIPDPNDPAPKAARCKRPTISVRS